MTNAYVCTWEGFCPGQTTRGRCLAKGHPERKKCPYLEIRTSKISFPSIYVSEKSLRGVDLESLPLSCPLYVIEQLMEDRRV